MLFFSNQGMISGIPVIDLSHPEAKSHIVYACEEYGFFKLINHGVPMNFMSKLETEAIKFFGLPQTEKDKAGPPDPFGFGSKQIGPNGDMGWIEYILLNTNPLFFSEKTLAVFDRLPEVFRSAVEDYIRAVKEMAYEVLEKIADGMKIEERSVFSKLLKDEGSDSCFRINHYPSCSDEMQTMHEKKLLGFGEHTDPQIISVLRSNNISGLQICLKDGSWVPVPADKTSFFINVGDAMQVMSNGRFRSVKHRVIAGTKQPRVSMIYFGGPPLSAKIAPLASIVEKEEDSLYKEFTWCEYKNYIYKSKLSDYRLGMFEKKASNK